MKYEIRFKSYSWRALKRMRRNAAKMSEGGGNKTVVLLLNEKASLRRKRWCYSEEMKLRRDLDHYKLFDLADAPLQRYINEVVETICGFDRSK